MCCCDFDFDNVFLLLMTAVCVMITYVDVKVLEKMFEEYFMMSHYLDQNTYNQCYKPQSIMRICLECYAVYCAMLSVLLTGAIAINLPDASVDWLARKIVNLSALVFGPVLFTLCAIGVYHWRDLSVVCGLHGVYAQQFNGVCIFLLFVVTVVSLAVNYGLVWSKTLDVAEACFADENSILYRISQIYFRYQQRVRE